MRILYVTQTFPPEPLATERYLKQAVQLQHCGHRVTVLTSMPYYPLGQVAGEYRGRRLMRERIEGVPVVRVWSLPAAHSGAVRRAASYLSFAAMAAAVGPWLGRRDVVMASVPNPATELAGLAIARLTGAKLLLEMVDIVPDNLALIGISPRSVLSRALAAYYRAVYRCADLVAAISPTAAGLLARRGLPASRVLMLPNGADFDLLAAAEGTDARGELGLDEKFVVVYAGSFSSYYGMSNIVAAAEVLQQRLPRAHLLLVGTGSDWAETQSQVQAAGLANVTLTGAAPPAKLAAYMRAADAFLFSMVCRPTPAAYQNLLTAKTCQYLMFGRPVIAVEAGPICGPLLERIGAGVAVPADDPHALAGAVERLASNPAECSRCGERAAQYAAANLDRRKIVRDFAADLAGRLAGALFKC